MGTHDLPEIVKPMLKVGLQSLLAKPLDYRSEWFEHISMERARQRRVYTAQRQLLREFAQRYTPS